jgi:SAM-dependent methyltransferase
MTTTQEINAYYEGAVEPIYRSAFGAALHLAMFEGDESREKAQTRTKEFLAARLPQVSLETTIVDLGSGYGDAARFLVQRLGCKVVGVNLVHTQNVLALSVSREAGFGRQISAIEADFGHVPLAAACTQVVWSQEALLHAPDRGRVLTEAARLLQPGGVFIYTDLVQTGPLEPEEARLIYERVKITSFETFEGYRVHLQAAGLQIKEIADLSPYVARSYGDHIDEIRAARDILVKAVGADFVDYTIEAMGRWVTAANEGKLGWGMFVARKP